MGKKKILADFLSQIKVLQALNSYKAKSFFVINYHRLYSENLQTQFDEGVFEYAVDTFETHLKYLKNNFDVISERDVINMSIDGKIPKRCALITFDDGYIDNYTVAFPLLKAYNLPAIFFIPTEAIARRMLGWWDIASYLIKKSQKKEIVVADKTFLILHNEQKKRAIAYALGVFKKRPYAQYKNFMESLSSICDVEIPTRAEQNSQLMIWEQLTEMMNHNITIGSHTHTHRVLSTLDVDEQLTELEKSKKILENKINCTINSLSYPVGGYAHFSRATKKIAKKAGYKICFSYNTGFNKNNIDNFDIKRLGLSHDFNVMQGQLLLPSIFC